MEMRRSSLEIWPAQRILGSDFLPDFKTVTDWIDGVLKRLFGDHVPSWIQPAIGIVLGIGLIMLVAWATLFIVSKITELWSQKLQPIFYNPEQRRRAERRRRFSEHLKSRLALLNSREAWQDYKFTELEAEVEAEGKSHHLIPLLPILRTRDHLRRESSLSAALKGSRERLILVEGEPGSGKSVALRHVANVLAERATKAHSTKSLVPLYINLKELKHRPSKQIDRNFIETSVLAALDVNDRDVEEFLQAEFKCGMAEGTWLFLFDSFDELPDVLGSTETDEIIRIYAEAIHNFLHGMNLCRGIIASRYFRGPGGLAWPRFRIQPLSRQRRVRLVRKVNLEPSAEREFLNWLDSVSDDFNLMLNNPMFLGLLCNHIKTSHPLPQSTHAVFETYIQSRLTSDAERLKTRYSFNPVELRTAAEQFAFCMAAQDGLGLNPSRQLLHDAMVKLGFKPNKQFETALNALEFMKLARSGTAQEYVSSQVFTFSHRRFQEYFATCLLLREPHRISPRILLTDARWRESVVVLFQTQPAATITPLLVEIGAVLKGMLTEVSRQEIESKGEFFRWPAGCLHICSILQDGFGAHLEDLPPDLRNKVGELLAAPFERGQLLDRKWALEVAGVVPSKRLDETIRAGFNSDSQILRDVAYKQAARLSPIPDDIVKSVRATLLHMARNGALAREQHATRAHVARLTGGDLMRTLNLLIWIPRLNLFMHGICIIYLSVLFDLEHHQHMEIYGFVVLTLTINYSLVWAGPLREYGKRKALKKPKKKWTWPKQQALAFSLPGLLDLLRVESIGLLAFFGLLLAITLHDHVAGVFSGLIFVYAAIWSLAASYAASAGEFTHPLAWIVIPFYPVIVISRNLVSFLRFVLRNLWVVILLTLGMFAIFWAAQIAPRLVLVISVLCSFTFVFLPITTGIFLWLLDLDRLNRFKANIKALDVASLRSAIDQFNSDLFRARAIGIVREKQSLSPSESTLQGLRRIALSAETTMSEGDINRAAYLDELSLLIEQMQKRTGDNWLAR